MKFLKPSFPRVIITVVLASLIKLVPLKGGVICPFVPPCFETTKFVPLWKLFSIENPEISFTALPFTVAYLMIIYILFAPALIVVAKKISNSKDLYQLTIWRFIIFLLGWFSGVSVVLQIMSQQRTGHLLWLISEYLVLILIPFTVISQALYYFSSFFLTVIFGQFDVTLSIPLDYPDDFSYLDIFLILLMLTLGWVLISHWIMLGLRLVRKRFSKSY